MVRSSTAFVCVVVLTVLATACGARSIRVQTADPTVRADNATLVSLDPFPSLPEDLKVYQGLGSAPVTKDLQQARDLVYVRTHRDLVTKVSTAYETRFVESHDKQSGV